MEWAAYRTLGNNPYALRLFPLVCGIASLFLFHRVARRFLRPRDVWIAVALFAVSDDLIYFASELKQYSTDVAAGLVCTLMGMETAARPATRGRVVALAAAGATIVWFSHPSVFVLAGVGTVLLVSGVAEGGWRGALIPSALGLAWVASFAAVYAVSMEQLGHRRDMWAFWEFAFPPMPPASLWDATWVLRRFVYLFVNPLNFKTPLDPRLSGPAGARPLRRRVHVVVEEGEGPLRDARAPDPLRAAGVVPAPVPVPREARTLPGPRAGAPHRRGGRPVPRGNRGWRDLVVPAGGLVTLPDPRGLLSHGRGARSRDFNPFGDRRPAKLDPSRFPF